MIFICTEVKKNESIEQPCTFAAAAACARTLFAWVHDDPNHILIITIGQGTMGGTWKNMENNSI